MDLILELPSPHDYTLFDVFLANTKEERQNNVVVEIKNGDA